MSLKGRTFKAIELNKYLEIIIILAFLSIVLAALKLVHGQLGNLTVNQINGAAFFKPQATDY